MKIEKINLKYLTMSEEKLKRFADADKKGGLEIIGDCLVEFFDLISHCPKKSLESCTAVLDSRKKIDLLLEYVSKKIDVSPQTASYKSLLKEYCTPKKHKTKNYRDRDKPLYYPMSSWPPTEDEWHGKFVRLNDCGRDVRDLILNQNQADY